MMTLENGTVREDLTVVRHLPSGIDLTDNPAWGPLLLTINLRPPELIYTAFVMLYGGSEEIVVRCHDRSAVEWFLGLTDLGNHPRLRWIKLVGPDGELDLTKERPVQ